MATMWREDLPRTTNPFQFLLFASKPYKAVGVWSFVFVILGAVVSGFTAYVFKLIVDAANVATNGGGLSGLWWGAGAYIVLSIMENVLWRGSGFTGMHWSTGIRATTRYALSSYVTLHSHAYFANRFAGSISSKITQAANSIKDIGEQFLWQFVPFFVTMGVSFWLAFITSPIIAFIFLAWIFVITPLNVIVIRWGVPLSVASQRSETAVVGTTVDTLTNISGMQEYAQRGFELSRLRDFIIARRIAGMKNWSFREYIRLVNGLLQVVFIGGMILMATYLTTKGLLSAGDIILILTIIMLVQDRLVFIGNQLNNFGDAWGQIKESLEDILIEYEIEDKKNAKELGRIAGGVKLDALTFGYGNQSIFTDLSLEIPAGQKVGLVGRSGAGKSTLIKLLLRHHEASEGSIRIDGTDISDVQNESLRRAIGLVPQEPSLFHRTIRENIAYGRPEASQEEIEHAAKLAQAHDFILQLPEGYESLVGERGVKLSGGQRQRVAIARAFLKDARILLLDEATSSLDSESEVAVQKALLTLMEGRTVIAIAHRLSTLRAMDRLIVMDQGQIVEDGSHDELLAKGGLYADLWNHQAGGFLTEEGG